MKKSKLLSVLSLSLLVGSSAAFYSCSDDDNGGSFEGDPNRNFFNIALAVGDDGNDGVYVQAQSDIASGAISFSGYGYEVPAERTARVAASNDGKSLYSLDYGGGSITKFTAKGGESYTKINVLDVQDAIGTHPRWAKVNDEIALLHNVTVVRKYKDAEETEYDYSEATADLVGINLGKSDERLSMGAIQRLVIPRSEEDIERNLNIWRIDAPVVYNGKVYYGVAKRSYDATTGTNVSVKDYSTTMLVADYPSLTNLKTISSGICTGENYGYRTPNSHVDERGHIYQIVGNGQRAVILRVANEKYDDSFEFDLSDKLGFDVGALGWFYVGEGVGYVPFYDLAKGQSEAESAWGIARIDLYKGTAVKLNVPSGLWLRQYQQGVLKNGKFYMALAPVGGEGAVYMFDPESTSADGFEKGAKLDNLGGQFYIGIF